MEDCVEAGAMSWLHKALKDSASRVSTSAAAVDCWKLSACCSQEADPRDKTGSILKFKEKIRIFSKYEKSLIFLLIMIIIHKII